MPPTRPDYDALLRLATEYNGHHVPLSAIASAGFSKQTLRDRVIFLRNHINTIIESQAKSDFICQGLSEVFDDTSALSEALQLACENSASLRPRAKHALEALHTISAVRVYLNSVISIRDALKIFKEFSKSINNDFNTIITGELVASVAKQVDLLCSVWKNERQCLGPNTEAYNWATIGITESMSSYRSFLTKAATNSLSDISWPCSQAGSTLRLNDEGLRNKTQLLLQTLLRLQVTFEPSVKADNYWVLSLLAEPIITRFMFHFERDCSTNRPDKPEWFLGFISRCLSQHIPVLAILLPEVPGLPDAFTNALLAPVRKKSASLLQKLAAEEDLPLFRHFVKHILSFNPSISEILSEPPMQSMFLNIERESANSQLEFIFDGLPSPWEPIQGPEQIVATNSSDMFLSMLYQISENIIKRLPKLQDRLNFAQLQQTLTTSYTNRCESLLSLRLADINHGGIRTSMVASANWSAFIGIINSLDSVRGVLEEWNDHLLYLELQYFRSHPNLAKRDTLTSADLLADSDFENSVGSAFFHEECGRCNALVVEFVELLVRVVLKAFRLAASFYISRNNLTQPLSEKPDTELSLSATLCDGLSVLSSSLNLAASQFGERSFQNFWLAIAKGLDSILYDALIRDKYYTAAAARQLNFDLNAILTLFRTYTARPDATMPMMTTALELLQSPIELIQELVDSENGLPSTLPKASVLEICKRILTVASVESNYIPG